MTLKLIWLGVSRALVVALYTLKGRDRNLLYGFLNLDLSKQVLQLNCIVLQALE